MKRSTTIDEQIALLRSRGMDVDSDLAKQWLSTVSYYRLSAYWYPARQVAGEQRQDSFVHGTTFSDVVALYEADRKLRMLLHDGIERIEIAMRTRLIEVLCETDPLAYERPSRFRQSFGHSSWMATVWGRISRAGKNNEAVKHHRENYDGRYPFWVLAEVLDFADLSRIYQALPSKDQDRISVDLGVVIDIEQLASENQRGKVKALPPLVRWMEQLTVIRNTCAHHARLWNRGFAPAPTSALRTVRSLSALPEGQSERVFGALLLMSHLLGVISPGSTWPNKVENLLRESFLPLPLVSPQCMGAPSDWDGALTRSL